MTVERESAQQLRQALTAESSCIQLLVLPLQPISIQKRQKKNQKGKMLQSAAEGLRAVLTE